jgi:acetate kinase
VNAGSSSLKISAFRVEGGRNALLLRGQVEGIGAAPRFILRDAAGGVLEEKTFAGGPPLDHDGALDLLLHRGADHLGESRVMAVGHRFVHGGMKFTSPVRIDAAVLAELEKLTPLAPLQQPHHLAAVRAVSRLVPPQVPQVACFDTSFHRAQPEVAQRFGLPRRFTDEGLRRYGFHGLSYEYIASVLRQHDAKAAAGRTIVAHLGNGASLCAMLGGRSVATTMSFTPTDGLVMGTRVGSIDPGALLYLISQHGMDGKQLEQLLNFESGLLGVSGISSDMRTLLASDDPRAAEAVELFVYRIGREIGSLAAALGGLDALVFTGGIGENAAAIRARVCGLAAWLGLDFDQAANDARQARLSRTGSAVTAWVLPTDEELMIATHVERLLGA